MKSINNFILEANYNSKKIKKALEDYAWGIIDEFNQEGVQGWDENDIKDYINSNKEPDFEDIVNAMIHELEDYGDKDHILLYLNKYQSDDFWKEIIEAAILKAMQDYVKDL